MDEQQRRSIPGALATFGRLVKELRLARDLTQEELAERAQLSARLISDLERGSPHRPRRDTVHLLADGLGLTGQERASFIALARDRPMPEAAPAKAETSSPIRSLPVPPTPIVGRLKETAAVIGLLMQSEVRLLTLTGPGGVGKTRLALEAADRVAEVFADGVVFVDLTSTRDPSSLTRAIEQAAGRATSQDDVQRQGLMAWLQNRRLLLVLDNVEHVIAGVRAVADLLASSAGLTVLATSREPLRVRAERRYDLAPLILPDRDRLSPVAELGEVPAVLLFVERAEAVDRAFALTEGNGGAVADIVSRLDGLPLAIELAAARVRVLPPEVMLKRLERRLPLLTGGAVDLPPRQQTMRAAVAWSYDLLGAEDQYVFRQLAVFAGSFAVDAAEPVARSTAAQLDVLDGLSALVDKSLVHRVGDAGGEPRFRMLETIREYALSCLIEAGEEERARTRHLGWYVNLGAEAEHKLTGPEQGPWFERLDAEHDNIRAALSWAIARGDAEAAMRIGGTLYRFWATSGYVDEGAEWLDQALALGAGARTQVRANALLGAGVMAYFQGQYDRAEAIWQESKSLFSALDDITGIAYSYGNLGLVADARGDYDQAVASYEEALALFRKLNDQTYIGYMLHNIGLIAHFQGDQTRADRYLREGLAICQQRDDHQGVVMALGNLGLVAFAQGDMDRARSLQTAALTQGREVANRPWVAKTIENVAVIAAVTCQPVRAVRLFAAAEAFRQRIGTVSPPNDQAFIQRHVDMARSELGEAPFADLWREGQALSLEEAIAEALCDDWAVPA